MDTAIAAAVLLVLFALPLLGLWAGLREKRKAGKREGGSAASMMGAGLMEVQNLLEPDRKIEVLRDRDRKRDLLVDVHDEADGKGDGD
jgi:hypothetical protein